MIFTECEDFDLDENTCEINEKQNEDIQALQDTDIRHNTEIKELQKSDNELDKKIKNVLTKALGNEIAIVNAKSDIEGLVQQVSNAQSDIAELQTDLGASVAELAIKDNELDNKIKSLKENFTSDNVSITSLVADNAEIANLTVTNLEQKNTETELIKANSAIIKNTEAASIKANVISGKIHHDVTSSLVNDELFHVFVPNYDGITNIQAENYELNVTVINNTLVTYNQHEFYLHRVDFSKNGVNLYFKIAFDYDELHIGKGIIKNSRSEEVDKTLYDNNVSTLTGVISSHGITYSDDAFLNVMVVDELPEDKLKNVIYVVKGDKSYFSDGKKYIPMTTEVTEDIDFDELIGEEL